MYHLGVPHKQGNLVTMGQKKRNKGCKTEVDIYFTQAKRPRGFPFYMKRKVSLFYPFYISKVTLRKPTSFYLEDSTVVVGMMSPESLGLNLDFAPRVCTVYLSRLW